MDTNETVTEPNPQTLAETVAEPGLRRFLTRFLAWGAAPTVDGYVDLFDPEGTLLDAGMEEPLRGEAIRTSMSRTLGLVPDFRFAPRRVVGRGDTVFVEATNRATLEGQLLRWDAVYCITERAGRVAAGRRYYDQAELYAPLRPGRSHPLRSSAPGPPEPAPTPTSPGPRLRSSMVAGPGGDRPADLDLDLEARARAWRDGDLDALLAPWAPQGPAGFNAPGFTDRGPGAPRITGTTGTTGTVRRYLAGLSALLDRPILHVAGQARSGDVVALEWRGRAGAVTRPDGFGMVELIDRSLPGGWRLAFDALSLQGAADVVSLRQYLQARSGPASVPRPGTEA